MPKQFSERCRNINEIDELYYNWNNQGITIAINKRAFSPDCQQPCKFR